MNRFDCAIIGAGPGGYVAALRAARRGLSTALIEKDQLGGTCLNRGCIPTKALLHVSELAAEIKSAADVGISTGEFELDYAKACSFKDRVVSELRQGVAGLLKNLKVQVFSATAKLTGPNILEVTDSASKTSQIQATNIIIATGTEPAKLPAFPFDGEKVMNTTDVLAMTSLPESILIVGGGIAGCEFATMFAEFGL
ncbi:MAG: FAD-dependent oxidoreductase, partial [Phycisphaerae bacterium]|nr:FAD-dependent oxidoreductase [Phycisphaerae bacterium]